MRTMAIRRRDACARKIRHPTWEDARLAGLAVWLENPNPKGANPPSPYPCSEDGEPHYHCGHRYVRYKRRRWYGSSA